MKRRGQILFIIMFLGIIFAMPMLTKLQKNKSISITENRKLAELPSLSSAALISGEYFRKCDTYVSDHIFCRSIWIKAYTFINMNILNKSKVNDIVIGKEGYLLPFYSYKTKYDAKIHKEKIEIMAVQMEALQQHIKHNGGSFYFIGIPEQSSFHKDKYPEYFYNNELLVENAERFMFSSLDNHGIPYINMNKVYREKSDKEYYMKTDHHYSFEGAYTAYLELIRKMQKDGKLSESHLEDKWEVITLPNSFLGSRNRQLYNLYPAVEKVKLATQQNQVSYEKYTNGKLDPKIYFYNTDSSQYVGYGVYMGGDWAETVIKTNRKELPNILIFGDSFTNALEPLLYIHFNETRILDLRHYKQMSLYAYIEKYKPDVVIMVRDDLNYTTFNGNGSFKGDKSN